MSLPETHPGYAYVILQGAGYVQYGRPIRGNFYAYKIPAGLGPTVERYLEDEGPGSPDLAMLLHKNEIRWTHRVDAYGREEL